MGRARGNRTYLLVVLALSAGVAGAAAGSMSHGVGAVVPVNDAPASAAGRSMIVSLDPAVSLAQTAQLGLRQLGSTERSQELPGDTGYVANLTAREAVALRNMPGVLAVTPNRQMFPAAAQHLERTNAPAAWNLGWRGEGQTVVVIDTGIDANAASIAGHVVAEACFTSQRGSGGDCPNGMTSQTGPGSAVPCVGQFECGHGTMVASIAVGDDHNGLSGVAPAADLIAVRVFTSVAENAARITTDEATLIRALTWVEAQMASRSIAAINLSLGGPPVGDTCAASPALSAVLERLMAAGVAVVASAGNDGSSSAMSFPACADNVISVGAEGDPGRTALFSNVSADLDLTAPGRSIEGAWTDPCCSRSLSGTSFAAPQVAAAFALLGQQGAPGSVASRLALLRRTGEPVYAFQTSSWSGASALRVDRALNSAYQSLLTAQLAPSTSPIGFVDEVRPEAGGFRVRGWALDADSVVAVPVHVYVDGVFNAAGEASTPRPDVAAAFPGYGPSRGLDLHLDVGPGVHDVCVYGINIGRGPGNVLIGCRTTVSGAAIGALDSVSSIDGRIEIVGWAIDTGHSGPTAVEVLVDGRPSGAGLADAERGDLAPYFPSYGTGHGYVISTPALPGRHDVCARGSGSTLAVAPTIFGCRSVTVGSQPPIGVIDLLTGDAGVVQLAGWALDPDVGDAIDVRVSLDGVVKIVRADDVRIDIGQAWPRYGDRHGFSWNQQVGPGTHEVCVAGIDSRTGLGSDLGCRTVTVS